jgi:hypothetical protein
MNKSWRTYRAAELQDLRISNPLTLIALFRQIMGLDDLEPLPIRSSFESVIQRILDYESWEREGTLHPSASPKIDPSRPTLTLNDSTISLIEHLRSTDNRSELNAESGISIADELFGPIDVCDPSIDWLAAARFANGSPVVNRRGVTA